MTNMNVKTEKMSYDKKNSVDDKEIVSHKMDVFVMLFALSQTKNVKDQIYPTKENVLDSFLLFKVIHLKDMNMLIIWDKLTTYFLQ